MKLVEASEAPPAKRGANSRGPWAYRRWGFHSFPRDPRVQQIEQQAFRHDAPEIVSRDHHLGEGVAENQLLLRSVCE